jgi:hypothetical protein
LDFRAIGVRFLAEERIFPLAPVPKPALGPTQPPTQWVDESFPSGLKRGRGVTLNTHPHRTPRSRMSSSYISSPPKRLHGVQWDSFIIIIIIISCHRFSFFPGTSPLEPVVNPTTQASSLSL